MAALEENKLLPAIAGVTVLSVGALIFTLSRDKSDVLMIDGSRRVSLPSLLEADADNTTDTIRALSGHVTELKEEVAGVTTENAQLKADKLAMVDAVETEKAEFKSLLLATMDEEQRKRADEQDQLLTQVRQMQDNMTSLSQSLDAQSAQLNSTKSTDPVPESRIDISTIGQDSGMLPGLGFDALLGSGDVVDGNTLLDVVWIDPIDRRTNLDESGQATGVLDQLLSDRGRAGLALNNNNRADQARTVTASIEGQRTSNAQDIPRFTIPDLSVLGGAVALSSMVGRIYTDDEVKDPWPFKVMIRAHNVTANHHALPDALLGMLFEGYAIGDWTLSCVRGWLTAASFVFTDGSTIAAYADSPGARPNASRLNTSAIGYLSDQFGNPCVKGIKVTDAPKYLASRSVAAGLTGFASAFNADNEVRQTSVGAAGELNSVSQVVDAGLPYALNKAYADVFSEGARWINERQSQSFDAVYVQPGAQVVVNVQSELRLDEKANARRISYNKQRIVRNEPLD